MDLELSDDQQDLRDNVRTVLEGSCPRSLVRSVFEGTGDGVDLWTQMVELYWPALALPEAHGGLGLGFVEVALVCEELGRAVAPVPYLSTVTQYASVVAELGSDEQQSSLLTPITEGATGTLALSERGRIDLATVAAVSRPVAGGAWVLDGRKSGVIDGATADRVAVVARLAGSTGPDGIGVFVVDRDQAQVRAREVLDPSLPLADIDLVGVEVPADRVLGEPGSPDVLDGLRRAVEQAVVALALNSVGACRKIFEETVDYTKVRIQYDKPIGSFQALKHRMADMFLSVERATALGYYAALTIAEDDPRRSQAAAMAKSAAGDCQRLLTEDGLQLHGGIGYTWEHDLHFLIKRAKAAEVLFGTSTYHRSVLVDQLGLTSAKVAS